MIFCCCGWMKMEVIFFDNDYVMVLDLDFVVYEFKMKIIWWIYVILIFCKYYGMFLDDD